MHSPEPQEVRLVGPPILSKETLLPLGAVVAVTITFGTFGWKALSAAKDLQHAVDRNTETTHELKEEIGQFVTKKDLLDRITELREDIGLWSIRLSELNPDVRVPNW